MEAILEGLLALSRIPKPKLEPLLVEALLARALRDLPKEGREGVRVHLPPESPWVLGEESLLSNVLHNALRHGGPPVEVSVLPQGEEVVLEVRDHGPGVPEEALGRLTQPFFRLGHGAGLGLALTEQAVRAVGGRLWLENARPGLRVRIGLKRAREDA